MSKDTVDKIQLNLLQEFSKKDFLNDYFLVGGTNLALRLNHRHSIDIDLFSQNKFDIAHSEKIHFLLNQSYGNRYSEPRFSDAGVFCYIDNVKVDLVNYPYPLLKPLVVVSGIKLADFEDIAAMKISAVTGRGSKKDFYDIYELLKMFTVEQLLGFYKEKYKVNNIFHVVKSLTYFNDAENIDNKNNTVVSSKNLKWGEVKSFISKKVNESFKNKFGKKLKP
jgi:predicted nucleotidyltransferase component of viral defense system